jgi:hypothetical protein
LTMDILITKSADNGNDTKDIKIPGNILYCVSLLRLS